MKKYYVNIYFLNIVIMIGNEKHFTYIHEDQKLLDFSKHERAFIITENMLEIPEHLALLWNPGLDTMLKNM